MSEYEKEVYLIPIRATLVHVMRMLASPVINRARR